MTITKTQFLNYESVRQSGVTNMYDVRVVRGLSGLTREEIFKIMKNYGSLSKKYL